MLNVAIVKVPYTDDNDDVDDDDDDDDDDDGVDDDGVDDGVSVHQ